MASGGGGCLEAVDEARVDPLEIARHLFFKVTCKHFPCHWSHSRPEQARYEVGITLSWYK